MYNIRKEYEEVQLQIIMVEIDAKVSESEEATEPSSQTELDEMATSEAQWYDLMSKMQRLVDDRQLPVPHIMPNNSGVNPTQSQLNVRLPVIKFPEFSGKYTEWIPFYDAFRSPVHENKSLENCQKFNYLKSCLKENRS